MFLQCTVLITVLGLTVCIPVDKSYLPPRSNSGDIVSDSASVTPVTASGENPLLKSALNRAVGGNAANPKTSFNEQVNIVSSATAETFASNSFKLVPVLNFSADSDAQNTYSYSYEAGNSITAEEKGDARGDGTKARGSYSFTLPNGEQVSLTYTADENGFVVQGSHIPTAPPVPEAIQKALEENAAAEARGIFDDGQYHGEGLEEAQYKSEADSHNLVVVDAKNIGENSDGKYATNDGYKY